MRGQASCSTAIPAAKGRFNYRFKRFRKGGNDAGDDRTGDVFWETPVSGHEAEANDTVLIGSGIGIGRQPPMSQQRRSVEDSGDNVGVSDIDR